MKIPVELVNVPQHALLWDGNNALTPVPPPPHFITDYTAVGDRNLGVGQGAVKINDLAWVNEIYIKRLGYTKTEVLEITDNRPAIRAVLREARNKRGIKVRTQSYLP